MSDWILVNNPQNVDKKSQMPESEIMTTGTEDEEVSSAAPERISANKNIRFCGDTDQESLSSHRDLHRYDHNIDSPLHSLSSSSPFFRLIPQAFPVSPRHWHPTHSKLSHKWLLWSNWFHEGLTMLLRVTLSFTLTKRTINERLNFFKKLSSMCMWTVSFCFFVVGGGGFSMQK